MLVADAKNGVLVLSGGLGSSVVGGLQAGGCVVTLAASEPSE